MSIQPLIKNDRLAHTVVSEQMRPFLSQRYTKADKRYDQMVQIDLIMDYNTNLGCYHHLASINAMHACQPTSISHKKSIN